MSVVLIGQERRIDPRLGGLHTAGTASARELGFQSVEMRRPEGAEALEPGVDLVEGSALTAYSRRAPAGRTEAKPDSRSTRRCAETAG
jgi:hypothetical protein